MRFLNHLTVEINSAQVASEIRGQSQQFLARVSHELRTPLNSILGFAKLLRRTEFSDTQNQYLSQIVEEGTQLNRLVSDLLDSAHLSTGKLTLRLEPCAITPLCETIAEEQRAALAPSVTLLTHFAPDLPRIDADPIRLRQALGNLVANAVKYTPSGTITITTSANGKAILIEVRDTGIGVSESQQEMIFLPFVQLDDRHVGVGLGLNIAQQIIRLHGGDIKLTSTPGQGSTFTVELPFTQN
jgi:signal transduction histidine kinase